MNANNKPSDQTPARLQQTPPSIGMHPTFRSDFNVSLRYFFYVDYNFVHLWFLQFI